MTKSSQLHSADFGLIRYMHVAINYLPSLLIKIKMIFYMKAVDTETLEQEDIWFEFDR